MGLFDFFKKKEEKAEKEENYFSNLNESIDKRVERSKEKEKVILNILKEKLSSFLERLSVQIGVLENIDLKDSRSDERLKFIVLENLSNYIKYLGILSKKLKDLDKESSEEFIKEIQNIFLEFKKNSKTSREKSTYLIGKEIRDVKENFGDFFQEINDFIEEEKSFFDELSVTKELFELSKKLSELNNSRLDIEEEKVGLENELFLLRENLENTLSNINRIKETPEYLEQSSKKEKIESLKLDLRKKIFDLKGTIDFKKLYNNYHHDPKKMSLIKEYDENFSKIISESNDSFLELLSKDEKEKVLKELDELKKRYSELKELVENKNPVEILIEDKERYEKSIEDISIELDKRQKSLLKLDVSEEGAKKTVSLLFEKIDANYSF